MLNPYGLIIAFAILAGTGWTAREFKKAGRDPNRVWEALPWVLVFGVIGARLYHVVHLWAYYSVDLIRVLEVWNGGLGIYGGLAGGIIGLIVFLCWRLGFDLKSTATLPFGSNLKGRFSGRSLDAQRTPTADLKGCNGISAPPRLTFEVLTLRRRVRNELCIWLNLAAPGLALGQAIGRVGNLVNRELLPFAGFEMVWDLVVFVLLVNCKKGSNATNLLHKLTPNGKIICGLFVKEIRGVSSTFVLYLFLYALGRFFLEFLRTDNVWRFGVLTVAQAVSLGIITITLILVVLRKRPFYPLADK
ncbi:MAG: prolipoprotein diacylglyceryl transferase family protein [Patescibacteria group bacterium]